MFGTASTRLRQRTSVTYNRSSMLEDRPSLTQLANKSWHVREKPNWSCVISSAELARVCDTTDHFTCTTLELGCLSDLPD